MCSLELDTQISLNKYRKRANVYAMKQGAIQTWIYELVGTRMLLQVCF